MAIEFEPITREVIGAAIDVHRELGPGLLKSAYEECLCFELGLRGIPFLRQEKLPITYKGYRLDADYRIDILLPDKLFLELKSVDRLQPIHEAQMLTYLRLSRIRIGLLMNFNVPILKDGLKRIVLG